MKRFFIGLLIVAFFSWVGIKITADPGYVLVTWHQVSVEMPLWLSLFGLIISFIFLYFLIRFIKYLIFLPKNWYKFFDEKHQQKIIAIEDQQLFTIIHEQPKKWHKVLEVLPQLEKKTWIAQQQINNLWRECYQDLLSRESHDMDLPGLELTWQHLPTFLKKDPRLLNCYVQALIKHHADKKAALLITNQLKKQWFGPLAQSYSLIKSDNPMHQLALAEKWLKKHADDPNLLLGLGRLCRLRKLWGKARDYLDKSLSYDASNPEIYQELGELFENLGEPLQALAWFKKGLIKKHYNSAKL